MTTAKCSSPPEATSLSFASLTMRVPRLCAMFGSKRRMPIEFGPWHWPARPNLRARGVNKVRTRACDGEHRHQAAEQP